MASQEVAAAPVDPGKFNMKAEEFRPNMSLAKLRESDLNPRKHYNEHKLQELAESIRLRGVITPLLARKIKGSAKGSTDGDGLYEIAAGHRRFRAAQIAGLKYAPVRIMDLDDNAFLEVVSIENLQREDIHPLEEGDGFRELLKRNGYDVATLADKIGKTEAYVRGRLELCDLVAVVRESFLRDTITIGHARLISRLDPAKQEEGLRLAFEEDEPNAPLLSVAEFRQELRRSQGADLGKAPFALDSEIGGVGPCTACPKCTGVQRSLLSDDTNEQTCLDRDCYDGKVRAHIVALAAAGYVQISNAVKAAEGAIGYGEYTESEPDREQIEEIKEQLAVAREENDTKGVAALEKELAEVEAENQECPHVEQGVYVDSYQAGKTTRICRNAECPIHGKELERAGIVAGNHREVDHDAEARRAKEAEERLLKIKARKRAWEALLSGMGPSPKMDRFFLRMAASGFYHRCTEDFCKGFGIEWKKGDSARNKASTWADTASDAQLIRFILAASFWEPGLQEWFFVEHNQEIWELFCTGLAKFGTSYEKCEKQVRAELAEKGKGKAKKADKPAKKKAVKPEPAKSSKMASAGDDDVDFDDPSWSEDGPEEDGEE
jgi:ParB/RepB/Spo0J family partition protein